MVKLRQHTLVLPLQCCSYEPVKGIMPHYKGWFSTYEHICTHVANENWAWQTVNKFTSRIQICPFRLSLQLVRHFKHRMSQCSIALTYQYSYPLAVQSWRSCAFQIDNRSNLCTTHVRPPHTPVHYIYCDTGCTHTSGTHFNWIFKLMSSLRSKYGL